MKKQKFNLQAQLSSESDSDNEVINDKFLRQYQKEYSFIMQQSSAFFKEIVIERFISLNQMGIGFNLPLILNAFSNMENTNLDKKITDKLKHKKSIKDKYQISFHQILQKMNSTINDLLNFELKFKQQYFGQVVNQYNSTPQYKNKDQYQSPKQRTFKSKSSLKSSQSVTSNTSQFQKKIKGQQFNINQLQKLLLEKLQPKQQKMEKIVKEDKTSSDNIDSINQKIEQMISKMKNRKSKQEKTLKIFNENRIENIVENGENQINYLFSKKKQSHINNNQKIKQMVAAKMNYNQQTSISRSFNQAQM